jgi:hypothetical protein
MEIICVGTVTHLDNIVLFEREPNINQNTPTGNVIIEIKTNTAVYNKT